MKKKLVLFTSREILKESGIEDWRVSHPQEYLEASHKEIDVKCILREDYRLHKPNRIHHLLAQCEKDFDITVITSCLDTYHELAGSTRVIHLFGCLEVTLPNGLPAPVAKNRLDETEDQETLTAARQAVGEADYCVSVNCPINTYPWDTLIMHIRPTAEFRMIYQDKTQSAIPPIRCVREALTECVMGIPSETLEDFLSDFRKDIAL